MRWSEQDVERYLRRGQPAPRVDERHGAERPPHQAYRSKTEQRYAWLLDGLLHDGQLTSWTYEAVKLRLGHRCWYTPDFLVVWKVAPWPPVLVEVKGGFVRDDARVKLMAAAHQYRLFRFQEARWHQGVWTMTEIPAH